MTRPRRRSGQRGSAVQAVLIAPALLAFVLGIVQFAMWQNAQHVSDAAAQQALLEARLEGSSAASGQARASAVIGSPSTLINPAVSVSRGQDSVRVDVSGEAVSVVPFVHLTVHAQASGPVERFRPPGPGP